MVLSNVPVLITEISFQVKLLKSFVQCSGIVQLWLREEMLRDHIVVGIQDITVSKRLQMDSELTLKKAIKMVQQKEAVREYNSQLRGN